MTPEGIVRKAVLSYLKQLRDSGYPIYYEQRTEIGYKYKKGLPDIWFVYNGQHVELEVKRPGGSRSSMQDKYRYIFKKINCRCITVESLDQLVLYMQQNFLVKS